MDWMILPFRRYADFAGRSQRKEYWMFALFVVIVTIVLNILDSVLGLGGNMTRYTAVGDGAYAAGGSLHGGVLTLIFSLAIIIPSIAVTIRRLHDIDKSGWFILVGLIPLVGWIIVLVWYCTDGTRGSNRFGPDPKTRLSNGQETFR